MSEALGEQWLLYHDKNKLDFHDDVCFVLDQHTELNFYSASSLKQQSLDRHVAPLGHIILIPSQPVFTPQCLIALHLEIQLTPYLQLSVPPHFQPMNATLSFSRCGNSIKIITMLVM